jgi:hypothetical protein
LTTAAVSNSPVGDYDIVAGPGSLADTNYLFSFTNGSLNVTQAALLVTASNQSRMYGATNPTLTYGIAGFLGTDTVSVVTGAPGLSTTANTGSGVGTYPVLVTNVNLSALNYAFNFANGTLTVTATPPEILSITGAGTTNAVITWTALSNATYRVRYISDTSGSNWQVLTPDVTATNSTASAVDNATNVPQRFYQVLIP